jgi:hypothetical protein
MTVQFTIDRKTCADAVDAVKNAATNAEKGKTLEHLAKLLFEGIDCLECKHSRLGTASSEVDLVVQYNRRMEATIFDEFGRYFLVECKNWQARVGAPVIRDFVEKMRKIRVGLGVLITRNDATGKDRDKDALREVHYHFDRDGLYVAVLSEEDLEAVKQGASFYDILELRIEQLRFDLEIR